MADPYKTEHRREAWQWWLIMFIGVEIALILGTRLLKLWGVLA